MPTKNRMAQVSNFTGGIFCVGAAFAALEWFNPLWTLINDQRMTVTVQPTAAEAPIDDAVTVQDASLTALVDAAQMSAGWVTLYALSITVLAVGIAALIIGYASFILAVGRESEAASRRWHLTISACGLLAAVAVTAGSWGLSWVERHIVHHLDLPSTGYEASGQSPFILLIAASVLILIGLLSSRTRDLEEDTTGLV